MWTLPPSVGGVPRAPDGTHTGHLAARLMAEPTASARDSTHHRAVQHQLDADNGRGQPAANTEAQLKAAINDVNEGDGGQRQSMRVTDGSVTDIEITGTHDKPSLTMQR